MKSRIFLKAVSLSLFVFGFAGWVYIVLNSEIHMWTLGMPLTHLLPFPREDTSGEISFVVSLISFCVWNYLRYSDDERKK